MHTVRIFTDGACAQGLGGWAALLRVIVHGEHHEKLISGNMADTTCNRMELQAVIAGLKALKTPCRVQIITDSKLIMNCALGLWKRKANTDLWNVYDQAVRPHEIHWKWVKGHNGHIENERVDAEARRQRKLLL